MAGTEQEMLEEIAYTEAEGPSDLGEGESEADAWDRLGEADGGDMLESETDMGDLYESEDSLEADGLEAEEAEESLGNALGNILGAEDEDEFFGKLLGGIKNIVQKAAPIVGKIARGAAPILSMIPHPAAQVAGRVAGVLGKLKAEGASIEDALEAVAEVAVRDPRALPVVAGLAARSVLKDRAATMSPTQRKQAVKATTAAAKTLIARGGPKAIRALPKIVRSVKRTAASKGTPTPMRPRVLARTAAKVAQRPALLRNLSQPSPRGQAIVQRTAGSVRTYPIGGDIGFPGGTYQVPSGATITIRLG
jgi:hypothetical protein